MGQHCPTTMGKATILPLLVESQQTCHFQRQGVLHLWHFFFPGRPQELPEVQKPLGSLISPGGAKEPRRDPNSQFSGSNEFSRSRSPRGFQLHLSFNKRPFAGHVGDLCPTTFEGVPYEDSLPLLNWDSLFFACFAMLQFVV